MKGPMQKTTEKQQQPEFGIMTILGVLIGGGCLVVALLGIVNTVFSLKLALRFYGSRTPLPDSYESTAGIAAVGVLIIGLTLFGGFVRSRFAAAKGRPLLRIGIVVGALALLGFAGRGVQLVALKSTYGSMLAYYATDGDLADVRSELAKHPEREALDEAVFRAAQYNNAPALALLLEAGADMRGLSRPEHQRYCPLVGRSAAFIKVAVEHGVKADACPNGDNAIWEAVNFGKDDAETAQTVTLLRGAGFSATAKPEHTKQNAAAVAAKKKWTQTVQALSGT